MQPNKLGIKLRSIRENNKLGTLKEFAPKVGVSNNTLATYELGTVLPDIEFLINFAEITGVEFDELLNLRIEASPATQGDIEKASNYFISNAQRHLKIEQSLKNQIDNYNINDQLKKMQSLNQDNSDYSHTLYIEHYPDVRAAAGSGQVAPTEQVMVSVAINADEWRRRFGLNHKNIKLITVYGDSMKPTLSHGDQVFVDIGCTSFIDDAIYAVQQGELTRIKRIKLRFDGSIEVRSDNEKNGFNPETYNKLEAADFHVIGRVIPYKFGKFEI